MTTASQIAAFLRLDLHGPDIAVTGFSQLSDPRPATLLFAKRYTPEYVRILSSRTDVLAIVTSEYQGLSCPYIISSRPRLDFIKVLNRFFPSSLPSGTIDPSAIIEDGAQIGEGVTIGAHCFVSSRCTIGDHTVLHPNVVLENEVHIGCRCELKSGVVIGQDGFGFERDTDGKPIHFPHYGGVVIGDDVFIGANACIDRGALGDTVIDHDVKVANLVHIAHNCHIGSGSFIIASSVLSGGTDVGSNCWIAPNVSTREHTVIGDNALVGLGSVVIGDVAPDTIVAGNPAHKLK